MNVVGKMVTGLAATFVMLAFASQSLANEAEAAPDNELTPVQIEILRLCAEMNKRLPMQVDANTILVTTLPQSDNSFVYKYKLINAKAGEITQECLTTETRPQAVAGYKTSMENIRALGIRLVFHYSDKDGNFIGSFTVGPED